MAPNGSSRAMSNDELKEAGLENKMISMRAVVCVDSMLNAKVALEVAPVATKDMAGRAITWGLTCERDPDMPAKVICANSRQNQPYKVTISEYKSLP